MKELIQKSLGSSKRYKIGKDKIIIYSRNINKYEEYYIKFDNLGFELSRKYTKPIFILIPAYLSFTALELYVLIDEYHKGVRFPQLLFWIGGVILFAIGSVYSFFQKKDIILIHGGIETLQIYGSKPNKKSVDNFIKYLHLKMRLFYKYKYAIIDTTLDEESQFNNYKWLKEVEAITDREYEELLHDYRINKLLN